MSRTLFITDAASALGQACAVRMGRTGWNLVLGGPSLSCLRDTCDRLPDVATLPVRCDPSDIDNIVPALDAGLERFERLDAVLINPRQGRLSWRRTLSERIGAIALTSEAVRPALKSSGGQLIITTGREGPRTLGGAKMTVARDAARTLADAVARDWSDDPCDVHLVEPQGMDCPKDMARRIARILMGTTRRVPGRTALPAQGLRLAR